MIQFNLLPDVKLEYVKAKRTMRTVTLISFMVGAVSLFIMLLLLLAVNVAQRKSLNDLNNDITKYTNQVRSIPNLDRILTVQNQLNTLTPLHDDKVVTSRVFPYISQLTPSQATISKLNVDFATNTMMITGQAPTLDIVNNFTDSLKSTKYVKAGADTSDQGEKAFNQVVLSAFERNEKVAKFTIALNFEPTIFNSADNITLTTPNEAKTAQDLLFQKEVKR